MWLIKPGTVCQSREAFIHTIHSCKISSISTSTSTTAPKNKNKRYSERKSSNGNGDGDDKEQRLQTESSIFQCFASDLAHLIESISCFSRAWIHARASRARTHHSLYIQTDGVYYALVIRFLFHLFVCCAVRCDAVLLFSFCVQHSLCVYLQNKLYKVSLLTFSRLVCKSITLNFR